MVSDGMFYKNAGYDYLYTKSPCGYATFVTGANPSQHGIVSDYSYDRLANKKDYCVYDNTVSAVGSNNHKENQSIILTIAINISLAS